MTVKQFIEQFRDKEEFTIEFVFSDNVEDGHWPNVRSFKNLEVEDVGYSGKVIILSGDEE